MNTVFLLMTAILSVTRPPVPANIPFAYDPNMVTAEILTWCVADPNLTVMTTVAAHNKWGLDTELTVRDVYDGNTPIAIQKNQKTKDPAGGFNQYWVLMVTPMAEGVHYIELICTDKVGRSDQRTMLILCVEGDSPFLFVESPPVITVEQAQRAWQYAKKIGYPITSPAARR